tara:strand:- start:508 stop:1497 length:990 start_codon:yes stop_codon:yes gene_type:complete
MIFNRSIKMDRKLSVIAQSLPCTIHGRFMDLTIHHIWHNVGVSGFEYEYHQDFEDEKVENIVNIIDIEIRSKILNDYYIDSTSNPIRAFDQNDFLLKMLSGLEAPLPFQFSYLRSGLSKIYTSGRQRGYISFMKSDLPIGKIGFMTDSDDNTDHEQYLEIDLNRIKPSEHNLLKYNIPKPKIETYDTSILEYDKSTIKNVISSAIDMRFMNFSPFDFEQFIADLYQKDGYNVEKTKNSGDFGADVIVKKHGKKFVIQVKRFSKNNSVGVKDINQVIGAKNYYQADKAIVVTTSSFSKPGKELASKTDVDLIGWESLKDMIVNILISEEV